jgi:DNA-directed RNA polymerase subunit M/transcription elongation factor TFIIS
MTARELRQRIPGLKKKQALALKEIIHQDYPRPKSYARQDKINQLVFNLKRNPGLLQTVDPVTLVRFTDDDFRSAPGFVQVNETIKSSRDVLRELLSVDTLDEEKLARHAPLMVCRKCGSSDVSFESRQTRSADEAATIFCYCKSKLCRFKWTMK